MDLDQPKGTVSRLAFQSHHCLSMLMLMLFNAALLPQAGTASLSWSYISCAARCVAQPILVWLPQIDFKLTQPGMMKAFEGHWSVQPYNGRCSLVNGSVFSSAAKLSPILWIDLQQSRMPAAERTYK